MLAVSEVAKSQGGRLVLHRVSFELDRGGLLIITGPNGAGKTTLLRILAGASRPDAGRVVIDGSPLERSRPRLRRSVGYLAHEPFLYPELTARQNLWYWARVYGAGGAAGRNVNLLLDQSLEAWGLAQAADRPVRTFSRGMRQRLGLARALLHRPRLLLLDEPLTGLDDDGRLRLLDALNRHLQQGGAAVVATHEDLPEPGGGRRARRARLEHGRLVVS
ncbi:MAG TPA: heme ABC exporter ATP-binding protein CcmA [Bacillota bacterium]